MGSIQTLHRKAPTDSVGWLRTIHSIHEMFHRASPTPSAPAVAEVVDLVDKPAGTVVHLRILPGVVGDYAAAVHRATTAA